MNEQEQTVSTTMAPEAKPIKIGKFRASKSIVKASMAVLMKDKEIMGYTIMSSIITTILAVMFYFIVIENSSMVDPATGVGDIKSQILYYGGLFIFYVLTLFVVNFYQAALFIVVQARFTGGDLNYKDGLSGASKKFYKILVWSIISSTVGLILRLISDKFKLVGRIVASIFGAAWNILTYFSLPSLVISNLSVKDSFKQSAATIRKTWGETIIVNFGAGLVFIAMFVALFTFCVILLVIFPWPVAFFPVAILFGISVVVLSVVYSTLNSIFKLVIFNYATTGNIPEGFSKEVVTGAIQGKAK